MSSSPLSPAIVYDRLVPRDTLSDVQQRTICSMLSFDLDRKNDKFASFSGHAAPIAAVARTTVDNLAAMLERSVTGWDRIYVEGERVFFVVNTEVAAALRHSEDDDAEVAAIEQPDEMRHDIDSRTEQCTSECTPECEAPPPSKYGSITQVTRRYCAGCKKVYCG